MSVARLVDVRVPRDPRGLVLVLHGGAARRGEMMVESQAVITTIETEPQSKATATQDPSSWPALRPPNRSLCAKVVPYWLR